MYILLTNIQSAELVLLYWTNLETVCQQDKVKRTTRTPEVLFQTFHFIGF